MLRFESYELAIVFIATRFLELVGIILSIILIFKGYKLRYVLATAGIVILSILITVLALAFREYFLQIAIADFVITAILLTALFVYVFKNPEKTRDFSPNYKVRCPFCGVLILKEDELCTLKIGDYNYYFESCDHLVKLLKDIDYFLEKGSIYSGELKEAFVKTCDTGRWKKLENAKIVQEGREYKAYENPPEGSKIVNLKEILDKAKDILRRWES
ncbi:hypothetical protein [Aquifex sp.]